MPCAAPKSDHAIPDWQTLKKKTGADRGFLCLPLSDNLQQVSALATVALVTVY